MVFSYSYLLEFFGFFIASSNFIQLNLSIMSCANNCGVDIDDKSNI